MWTLLVTKTEFPFKNELDYQIKPLKPAIFLDNFSGDLYFVFLCLYYRALQDLLAIGQNSGEETLSKIFFDVPRVIWGLFLAWQPS